MEEGGVGGACGCGCGDGFGNVLHKVDFWARPKKLEIVDAIGYGDAVKPDEVAILAVDRNGIAEGRVIEDAASFIVAATAICTVARPKTMEAGLTGEAPTTSVYMITFVGVLMVSVGVIILKASPR